jgi:signal transduction histidine kinase
MRARTAPELGDLDAGVTRPALRAIALLTPHLRRIEAEWRAGLHRRAKSPKQYQALLRLDPRIGFRKLRGGGFAPFRRELVSPGENLAALEVPVESAILAALLWLEICLPYLINGHESDPPAMALVRLNAKARLFIVSGYTNRRKDSLQKLERDLAASEEHLKHLSRIITEVYDKERRRISRDLHDEVGHDLVVLKLYLELIGRNLARGGVRDLRAKLDEAIALAGKAVERVRQFSFELGPAISDELGFVPALKVYARQFAARTGLRVHVRAARFSARIPSTYEMTLYRVVQGALSHVVRHARARHVTIRLASNREAVLVTLEDDGIGFSVKGVMRDQRHFGLRTMQERVALLGGEIRIESRGRVGRRARRGTVIMVRIPLLASTQP